MRRASRSACGLGDPPLEPQGDRAVRPEQHVAGDLHRPLPELAAAVEVGQRVRRALEPEAALTVDADRLDHRRLGDRLLQQRVAPGRCTPTAAPAGSPTRRITVPTRRRGRSTARSAVQPWQQELEAEAPLRLLERRGAGRGRRRSSAPVPREASRRVRPSRRGCGRSAGSTFAPGARRRPAARATTAAARATHRHGNGLPGRARGRRKIRLRRERQLAAELLQTLLERAHASASRVSRRRARARARRDLTVPRRTPSAAAVSSSESSSR